MPPPFGVLTRTRTQKHQDFRAIPPYRQRSRNIWATPGRDDGTTAQRDRKTRLVPERVFPLPSCWSLFFKQERRDRATTTATACATQSSEGSPLSAVSSEMTPTHSFSRTTKKGVPMLSATFGRNCLCVVGLVFLLSYWGHGFGEKTPMVRFPKIGDIFVFFCGCYRNQAPAVAHLHSFRRQACRPS